MLSFMLLVLFGLSNQVIAATTKQTTKRIITTSLPIRTTSTSSATFQCFDYVYFGPNISNFFGANTVPTIKNCSNTNYCILTKLIPDQSIPNVAYLPFSSYVVASCGGPKFPVSGLSGYQYGFAPGFGTNIASVCTTPLCNSPTLVQQLYTSNMTCENNASIINKKLVYAKPTNKMLTSSAVRQCYFCSQNAPCSINNKGKVQSCDSNSNSPNYGNSCSYGYQYTASNNSMSWIGGCNSTQISLTFASSNFGAGKLISKMVFCFSDLCNSQSLMKPLQTAILCQDGFYN